MAHGIATNVMRSGNAVQFQYVGKESSVKTLQMIAVVAALIVTSVITTRAQAATPDVNAVLRGADNTPITMGDLAIKFAAHLNPPFITSDSTKAINFLSGIGEGALQRPLIPIGGWGGDLSRNATVGDLTVLLVQQFQISAPSSTPGQPPSAGDYQNALLAFAGSTTTVTYVGMQGLFKDWIAPNLNPLGPSPTDPNRS